MPKAEPKEPLLILAAVALLVSTSSWAGPREDGLTLYERFLAEFRAGNQTAVAALFAPDALFYGTGSPQLVTTHDGVEKYFAVLKTVPADAKAASLGSSAIALSDDVVAVSGMWQWTGTIDGKTAVRGPLRMSMVAARRAGQWTIVQFHNSTLPAPPPAPPASGSR